MIFNNFIENKLYKNLKVVFEDEEIKILEIELLETRERNKNIYQVYTGEVSILEYSKKENIYFKFGFYKMTKNGELWYLFYKNIKDWDKENKKMEIVRTMNNKTMEYLEKKFERFGNNDCIIKP